jgi:hypothetical protein
MISGYYKGNYGTITLNITEQKDRLFSGQLSVTGTNDSGSSRQFAAALSNDGKSFTIVEYDGGYDFGTIVSKDAIELMYVNDNHPVAIFIDSLKRTP